MELEAFIAKWWKNEGSERANKDSFLNDLCAALGVEPPRQSTGDRGKDAYVFEADVPDRLEDGTETTKKIDLYKRGHFILEAKQYGNEDSVGKASKPKRMSERWYEAMGKAFRQAKRYAYLLNEIPPFIVACDIGYCFDIYCSFGASGEFNRFDVPSGGKRIPCRVFLTDLRDEKVRATLKAIFETPAILDLTATSQMVTTHVSERLAKLAKGLEEKHGPDEVATFLIRCIFTMFAEDVELLPGHLFTRALREFWLPAPEGFKDGVESLWQAMNRGGPWAFGKVLRFNGGLFANPVALPLTAEQIQILLDAADKDWSLVEPAIFGTLIEQALEEKERHSLGAHFTPRAYVERLVEPTVMQPLREEWERVQQEVYILVGKDKVEDARQAVREFQKRLASTRVLDPACGTGNFLYVSLDLMKQLEDDVLHKLAELGDKQGLLEVGSVRITPAQFLGIEKNPRAVPIAELVLWIGYLRWHFRQRGKGVLPPEPVLQDFKNIECRDAVLAYDREEPVLDAEGNLVKQWDGESRRAHPVTGEMVPDETKTVPVRRYINPQKAVWPKADIVVGNPPFLGNKRMRLALGDGYAEALRRTHNEVPATADFVMYWWNHAADLTRAGELRRFGFITTNSITQAQSRGVVATYLRGKPRLFLSYAVPDHPWVETATGAAVRIAMTVVGLGEEAGVLQEVEREVPGTSGESIVALSIRRGLIHADLTIGADVGGAERLSANAGLCYMGVTLVGEGFRLTRQQVKQLGYDPVNSPQVIRPYLLGRDLAQRPEERHVIDFFGFSQEEARNQHPRLYQWIRDRVHGERQQNKRRLYRDRWWVFGEAREGMRLALRGLQRYVATGETAKHRFFVFLDASYLPDHKLYAVATDDAFHLGVLSSRVHAAWALAAGGHLGVGNDPTWTNSTCFLPFPFPERSTIGADRIRELAEQIDLHRKERQAEHPKLTVTAMYNVLAKLRADQQLDRRDKATHEQGLLSVLLQLHSDLDAAVFDAYGWPHDLSDDQILERLVALNAERAEEERKGIIRWLRPEFQNATGAAQQTELETETPEVEEETAAAPKKEKAKVAKQPWPTRLKERLEAVHNLLRDAGKPLPLTEVTGAFKAAKAADVEEVLESLAAFQRAIPQDGAGGTMWGVG